MGYLADLKEILGTVSSASDAMDRAQHKSIARGALDGTCQFPCLVSDSIPIETASVLARTLERQYASFVQIYLSMNPMIDISIDKSPQQYMKKFHQNVKTEKTEMDTIIDEDPFMERVYDGSTKLYINEAQNFAVSFDMTDKFVRTIYEANKEQLEDALKDIDCNPFPMVGNSPFYEWNPADLSDTTVDQYVASRDADARSSIEVNRAKSAYDARLNDKLKVPVLLDKDVKKSNDMQPYALQVRLMAVNDKKEFVQFMDFIVGVKVILHPVKSDEMITNVTSAIQNNGKLFNFIKWTTGEKSLFKDIILQINDIKLDVANKSAGSSPWWITLKRIKQAAKAQSALFARHKFVPQSTIVVSSFDVDYIKEHNGYDLRDTKIAKKLMNSLFLMTFIIVDDGTRTIDILFDNETEYQTYALETLEREVTASSNKLGRELTRMISR